MAEADEHLGVEVAPTRDRSCMGHELVAEWTKRYRDALVLVAMDRVVDRDRAEDIVQEVLGKVLTSSLANPRKLEEVRNPYGWLSGIMRNALRSYWRTEGRRARILRENELEIRKTLASDAAQPAWDVDWLSQRTLEAADGLLSPKQLVIVRGMLAGKDDAEIAREEGIARPTVRWHRREAIRASRARMADDRSNSRPTTRHCGGKCPDACVPLADRRSRLLGGPTGEDRWARWTVRTAASGRCRRPST